MNFKTTQQDKTSEISLNPTGIDVGLGVRVSGIQKFLTRWFKTNINTLDLAIEGNGFSSYYAWWWESLY